MTNCEDFEIATEQRRHGALDGEALAALEQHLGECAACAAFDRLGHNSEETMKADTIDAVQATDWAKVTSNIDSWRRSLRFSLREVLIAAVVMLGVTALLGTESSPWWTIIPAILAVLVVQRHWARQRLAEFRQAESNKGALLACYREQLDQRLATERASRWLLPAMTIFLLGYHLLGDASSRRLLGYALLSALAIGFSLNSHFRVLPRLRRERAELD